MKKATNREIEEKFLDKIIEECFKDCRSNRKERERYFLPLRFARKNRNISHTNIAKKMNNIEMFNDSISIKSITTTAQNVNRQIIHIYQEEMNADECNTENLLNRKNGQGGVWEIIYDWLWDYKYPRYLWVYLKEKATNNDDWIGIPTHNKKIVIPEMPKYEIDIIPLNKPFDMFVNLPVNQGYLLLLNQGENEQFLLCPSLGFAPQCELNNKTLFLPQKDSLAREKLQGMLFDKERKEEFIGIVLKTLPKFDWLTTDKEPVVKLTRQHFEDLLSLEMFENCPIFYKLFAVGA